MSRARHHYAPPRDHAALQRRAQAARGALLAVAIGAALAACLAYWASCDAC